MHPHRFPTLFLLAVGLAIGAGASGTTSPAAAQSYPDAPMLRIETGRHTAVINRIGVDTAERFVVTGSDDKTVRVWSAEDGRLLQVLRPPIGTGDIGKLYAVALSPDGNTIAAGGWTSAMGESESIYLLDRSSGQIRRRLTDLPDVVLDLAFSPDGQYLAAGTGSMGLFIWRTMDWRLMETDEDFDGEIYGLSWSKNLELAVSSYDGFIRIYDRDFSFLKKIFDRGFSLKKKRSTGSGKQPHGIAINPEQQRLAVGYGDLKRVEIRSTDDLRLLESMNLWGGDEDSTDSVTWSKDGRFLYGGGRWWRDGAYLIRRWKVGTTELHDFEAGSSTIMDLHPLSRHGLLYGDAQPRWGRFDDKGTLEPNIGPVTADFRNQQETFLASGDGMIVVFGLGGGGEIPLRFSLSERTLTPHDEAEPDLFPARLHHPDLAIEDWQNGTEPTLNGDPIELHRHEPAHSLAITPSGDRFLLGASWSLRFFESDGTELWEQPVPEAVWNVTLPERGDLAIAAYGDGTVRWHRLEDGEELLALFVHRDDHRWVAWTPGGYYMASPGGEDLIGWHVNNGPDQTADFFPVHRFRGRFNRPDVVEQILDTGDEAKAVRFADQATDRREKMQPDLRRMLPPVITVTDPEPDSRFRSRDVTLTYNLRSPSGRPVRAVKVLVDGRIADVAIPRGLMATGSTPTGTGNEDAGRSTSRKVTITLPRRSVEVSLIAETDDQAVSTPASLRLVWAGDAARDQHADTFKPKMYAVLVGVSDYQDDSLDLLYAAKDARDLAQRLKKQEGGLYRSVDLKLLTDTGANTRQVLRALTWLRRQTTSRDIGLVFLSGHGVNDADGNFFYLPHDAETDFLLDSAVSHDHIRRVMAALPGKAVFFADTCHSGNVVGGRTRGSVDIDRLANELSSAENGVVVFASATGRQISIENARWQNGAFTEALLDGLDGDADYTRDGALSINELDLWLAERVKTLTNGQQSPTTTKPQTVPNFPLFVVN